MTAERTVTVCGTALLLCAMVCGTCIVCSAFSRGYGLPGMPPAVPDINAVPESEVAEMNAELDDFYAALESDKIVR